MATPLFPAAISFGYPFEVKAAYRTLISAMDSGTEVRHQRQAFPKREILPNFSWLSATEINLIWSFYQARKGALESFHLIAPLSESWYGEFIGLGTGGQTIFDFPSVGTTPGSNVVYVNGVVNVDYDLDTGTGENGADRLLWYAAPANGAVLTADFIGRRRFLVRFKDDNMSRSLVNLACYQSNFGFAEVLEAEAYVMEPEAGGLLGIEGGY